MLALWLLIKDLPAPGGDRIDLGPGGETYKDYFANAYLTVASGQVDSSRVVAAARKLYRMTKQGLRSSPAAHKVLKIAVQWMRKARKTRLEPT
jgi:CelD/BcsL family acetyltransferase involved in cellulose biosynthesis